LMIDKGGAIKRFIEHRTSFAQKTVAGRGHAFSSFAFTRGE
jgi:hypothetical protein